jgi:hypothetical protein
VTIIIAANTHVRYDHVLQEGFIEDLKQQGLSKTAEGNQPFNPYSFVKNHVMTK